MTVVVNTQFTQALNGPSQLTVSLSDGGFVLVFGRLVVADGNR